LSKTAAKGWWIPVRPADGDTALAVGMIRWIIENGRYDEAFLRNANLAAAKAGGEKSWTNATWLVDPETGRFLRASDLGLVPVEQGGDAQFVALVAGKPVAFDANDAEKPVVGDLDAAYSFTLQTANGPVARQAKTAFRLLRESVFAHSLEFYAQESGVGMETLVALAREFTSHGKKAAIDFYRGPIKQTNGYLTAQAIILLNYLIGNVDHRGGLVPGGGSWNAMGEKPGQPFNLKKLHPGALTPFGVKLTRESSGSYESSTLFQRDGYPAKRPWFPFTSDVYQEIIPAAAAGYPYPIQILWLHYGTPALASPAGHRQIEMLRDVEKIPLLIATDIVIGETSMYADYLFPDLSYLERWGNPMGTSPATLTKTTKVRQPVAAPIPEIVQVDGEPMPVSMDALMLALAKRLGAPGYGRDGFAPGWDFDRPEQFYLKMVANVAWGDHEGDAVPEADAREMELLRATRRHLPAAVFDENKWKAAVGAENWPRVVTVLNRGGRFEAASAAYDGAFVKHPWGKLLDLYVEPVGTGKDSITGKRFPGIPAYRPLAYLDGSPVRFPEEYSLQLITYKEIFGGQSRTASNYAAQLSLMPENFVYINAVDARRLGLRDGDEVLVTSPDFQGSFDVAPGEHARTAGKVRVIQGIRPGTVMVSWHYGHWAYGARDVVIDGRRIPGDSRRGSGLVPNPAMAVDAYLKDVSMTDPIAGDAAYSTTRVKLVLLSRGGSSGPIEPGTPAFGEAGPVEVLAAGPRAARPGANG
ncbi:MAG: molybdopterin-dependent oxidoreductase, partial [Clostridia bacterium]|nr:molybdopterin-dependent oxidoreductase [Clostridia bacterium]